MKKIGKIIIGIVGILIALALIGFLMVTRDQAHTLVTNPRTTRDMPKRTPADLSLPFQDVTVTTTDGLKLVGWYIPTENGAVVIAQHGYKSQRDAMLEEAEMLHRHGYGVLIGAIRAHDGSDGEQISFGQREMVDMDAWYNFVLTQPDVDPQRIGILGNSLGGSLVIQYASQNPAIKAVVTNCAFSSMPDTVETSVTYFTGLPAFPFAPAIVFWAERELGASITDIDATEWVDDISSRPILLMQGGSDVVVSAASGERLFAAAGEPKELWFEPSLGHTEFDTEMPTEYEQRVITFFDSYLLDK